MNQDTQQTKVIFRAVRHGEFKGTVTAIFPEFIGRSNMPDTMECYEHIGQHSACDSRYFYITRLATEQEYAGLKKELESIGYNLRIVKKATHADYLKRLAQMH